MLAVLRFAHLMLKPQIRTTYVCVYIFDCMIPDVSIIIVSYNCATELRDCLCSITRETRKYTVEIIVVDNHSQDETLAMLARDFPYVHTLQNRENIGFAAANNRALAIATGRYILYLNPDTVLLDGAIDTMTDYMERNPNVGITGPHTYNADGHTTQLTVYGARSLTTVFHSYIPLFKHIPFFRPTRVDVYSPDHTCAVEAVRGCCMLLPAALVRTLGGMDERYFMYEEEYDLCEGVQARGLKVVYLHEAHIIHLEGRSSHQTDSVHINLSVEMLRSIVVHFRALYPESSLRRLRLILLTGSLWRYLLFTVAPLFPSKRLSSRTGRKEQAARLRWLLREYSH